MVSRYDQASKLTKKVILENGTEAGLGALIKRHDENKIK